jgi:hypothetical protein
MYIVIYVPLLAKSCLRVRRVFVRQELPPMDGVTPCEAAPEALTQYVRFGTAAHSAPEIVPRHGRRAEHFTNRGLSMSQVIDGP